MPLKYHAFEKIVENRAFALLEQMLHFLLYFQKYSKLNIIFSWIFSMLSKNRKWYHDLKIAYGVKGLPERIIETQHLQDMIFLHTGQSYLTQAILPRLSRDGYIHSDVIVLFKWRHYVRGNKV